MWRDCAWREVKKPWMMEAEGRSKLGVVKHLMEGGCTARCVQVGTARCVQVGTARCVQVARRKLRRIMAKLKGGTAELRVETGRWLGLKREDRHFNTACT